MMPGDGKILVVEPPSADSELNRLLTASGYAANSVATNADCVEQVKTTSVDLVLLSLPNVSINPRELIVDLVKISADLPIVLVSVDSNETELMELLEAGASDFLRFVSGQGALLRHVLQKNIEHHRQQHSQKVNARKLNRLNAKLGENLKLLERDQQAGFRVQQGMMPTSPITLGSTTFAHQIYPSLILSGDFIDYFELRDGRKLFYMADVSGHGASSAFVTVLLKTLSRRLQTDFDDLAFSTTAAILKWLNHELLQCDLDKHVTMFLGILNGASNTLEYSNAAQFPAAILCGEDSAEFLEIGGLPLGLYQSPEYDARTISLPPRFNIVMFSDGVFEIMPQQTLKAKEEHLLSVVKCGDRHVDTLAEQLGISGMQDIPDDIAVFTVAGVR